MEQIMADPDWLGRQPLNPAFSADSKHIVYQRKREGSVVRDLFITDSQSGNGQKAALSDLHKFSYSESIDDKDKNFVAWIYQGDVFAQFRANEGRASEGRGTELSTSAELGIC